MAFCEKMCDGCGLAAIEDPVEREAARLGVEKALDKLGRAVIHDFEHEESLKQAVEIVCPGVAEHGQAVAASLLQIVNKKCSNDLEQSTQLS